MIVQPELSDCHIQPFGFRLRNEFIIDDGFSLFLYASWRLLQNAYYVFDFIVMILAKRKFRCNGEAFGFPIDKIMLTSDTNIVILLNWTSALRDQSISFIVIHQTKKTKNAVITNVNWLIFRKTRIKAWVPNVPCGIWWSVNYISLHAVVHSILSFHILIWRS